MKPKRYNILYLDSGSGIGGGQRSLLLLLKHLDRNRFSPLVGCLENGMLAAEVRNTGVPIIPLNLPEAHDKGHKVRRFTVGDIIGDLRQISVISQLLQTLRSHCIDLIHANSLAGALIGGVAAKLSRVPIVLHKRYATSYGILDRVGEKLVNRVILVSEATRWHFAPRTKQVLIYNGVEIEGFNVSEEEVEAVREGMNLSCMDVCMGIVTRITPEKGIHLLIEAMAKLKNVPKVKLIVVGGPYFLEDTAYVEKLKSSVKKLGIGDRVIFTGFRSDTQAIMALLDIVLLASIIPEACPRTIIEAMAAGKPVIATPLGGSKELVTSETGVLIPPDDASAFADAIAALCEDRSRLIRMGKAARLRAERFFSVEQNTRLTEGVYKTLLEN